VPFVLDVNAGSVQGTNEFVLQIVVKTTHIDDTLIIVAAMYGDHDPRA
jgi:hypothetical protein